MNKLTPEQIIFVYNKVSGRNYAFNSPQVNFEAIQSITKEAWKHAEDEAKYKYLNIQSKAAVMCLELSRQKPFPDNNLKTAMLASITMLELNGFYIKLDETTAQHLAIMLTDKNTDYKELAEWFKTHTVKSME